MPSRRRREMAEDNGIDNEEYEEQLEQMMIENGMLLHGIVNLLVRKGVITQEEIDAEIDKLYEEMDEYDDEDDRE
jgi:hypothetical protein